VRTFRLSASRLRAVIAICPSFKSVTTAPNTCQ
jgi:hypothetical protein